MLFEKSETLQNLVNSVAGETQARNRYAIYAKIAKKEGLELISDIFLQTSENEFEHAKLFYKKIPNGMYKPNGTYPFFSGNTYENLLSAHEGEKEEWEIIYKNYALTAKAEGFEEISKLYTYIAEIEKRHAHCYIELAENLKNGTLYNKSETSQWICKKCGHTHIGKEAPCLCPVCQHGQEYFSLFSNKI